MPGDELIGGNASSAGADRNLLFGVIALQNDFITREQLVAAFDAWVHDKSRGLADILEKQGALSTEDRGFLDRLVEKFLAKHGGDAEKSLAALSAISRVRPDLEQLNDPDLGASLGHVGKEGPPDPRLDTTLTFTSGSSLGRFRILRPHAKGGLGQVSVALDQDLNREVALKEIQPQHADDQISRERFVLEAEITGGLEHPGIVPVYALGSGPDGRPFYAMRFVKGDSLKQAIEVFHKPDNPNRKDAGARQLALRQLLGRFIDVCNAMEYAHSRGVLHRDLKPGNIMVGKYGETLVVDWGLAKSVGKKTIISDETTLRPVSALSSSGQTRPGSAVGTPAYMSPEQAVGKLDELGPPSDVYSLGATLYHVLCGRPPFEKVEHTEILAKVQRGDFQRPTSVVADIPAALEAICLKAMSLQPADRYQTPRALADDLEHWLADEPVAAAPDTLGDRASRIARKHRSYVRAGAVAVVLIAIVSTLAALLINEARDDALSSAQNERDAKTKAVELAKRNQDLAEEKSQLADSERKAKTQAQKLAEEKTVIAADERKARVTTERQLRIATAERLAALSHTKRSESPELSLLLAVESGRATRHDDEGLLPSSHQALLDAIAGIGGRPLVGHRGGIGCVAISPNGRWIVTGSSDATARIWDLTAENPAASGRTLTGHLGPVRSIAFSSDNRWVVTGSDDNTARVWDLIADNIAASPRVLAGHESFVTRVAVSPDSRSIVTGSWEGTARIWDLTAENPSASPRVLNGHREPINALAISADSRWIVTGSWDRTARVWDLMAADPNASPRVLTGHEQQITSVAISPNGRWIVTGSLGSIARVWDLAADDPAANPRALKGHQEPIDAIAISPDSRWVVTGSWDRSARIWDLAADNPSAGVRVLNGHQDQIYCIAISPDSRRIVTGSADKTARVWDLAGKDPAATSQILRGHQGGIHDVAISPDGRWIVTASADGTARLWGLTAGTGVADTRALTGHQGGVTCVAISHDNRWAVTGSDDGTARVWDLADENPSANPRILDGHRLIVLSVAISGNDRWIVTGGVDSTVRVWDLAADNPAANPRILIVRAQVVSAVAISRDGRWVVAGGHDKRLRIFDLAAKEPSANPRVLDGHELGITDVAISADDRWIVSAGGDSTARVWDLAAGNPAAAPRLMGGHQRGIESVAISSDSRWIVTGGDDVRVWDLAAEDPAANPRVLSRHLNRIKSVAISADSRWIVTGSERDSPVRVWDLAADRPAASRRDVGEHQLGVTSVAISPDGRIIVAGSRDKTARVWRWQWNDLALLAAKVGRNAGREEWNLYFHDKPYRKTFAPLPIPGDPQTAIGYVERGVQSEQLRKYEDALIDHSEAIRLDPNLADAYNGRAWIYAAASDLRFRNGQSAVADATKACNLTAWKKPEFIDTLAAAYAEAGDFGEAVKWQTNALELVDKLDKRGFRSRLKLYKSGTAYHDGEPDDPNWTKHLAGATAAFKQNDFKGCVDECLAAIAIDADKPGARELLVKAALHLQDWKTVDVQSRILIDENPQGVWIFHEYGSVLASEKRWPEVVTAYARAARLASDEIRLLYFIAMAQMAAGDLEAHRQTCNDMLDRFGKEPTAETAAWILSAALADNRLDSAELIRTAKATGDPKSLAHALCRAGQYEESLKAFPPGMIEFTGRALDWLFIAIAQHGAGKPDDARESLKKARKWIGIANGKPERPGNPDAWNGWWERVEVSVLLAEVENLLGEKASEP